MTESEELEIARRNYLAATARADSLSIEARLLRGENERLRVEWLQLAGRLDEISVVLGGLARWMRFAKKE